MIQLIASVMPHAVGVALSPLPIAALLFILLSNRAKINSIAFLLGWFIALVINVGIASLVFQGAYDVSGGQKSPVITLVNIIFGLILLYFAWKEWATRPKVGETPKTPKWLNGIEKFSPALSFISAFTLVTVNAKNTILDLNSGAIIGKSATSLNQGLIVVLIYSFVATLTIMAPVAAFLLGGRSVDNKLNEVKEWFIYHNNVILFVLFLILGVSILSKAF